jgi:TRAP-type C4-dicarboxylate transport system permease small subunit
MSLSTSASHDTPEHGGAARGLLWVIASQRRFNRWMHYVAGVGLTAMLAVQVANIIGRKGFQFPILGTVEMTRMLLAVVVFLGLAYSEDLGDHITIDLIYVRVGPRARVALDLFSNVFSIAIVGLVSWQLFRYVLFTRRSGEDTGTLDWPIWPFVLVAAIGSALYALATVSKLVLRALGEPTDAPAPRTVGEVGSPEI